MDPWTVIAAALGVLGHWFVNAVANAWHAHRRRRALPINRFAGVMFPPPDDPDWRYSGFVWLNGPVRVEGCELRVCCHGFYQGVEASARVVVYREAIQQAQAIGAYIDHQAGRAREMLS